METVQTQVHGQPIVYQLDDTEVVLGKRRLALADVARVRLARFAEMWACELELRDGTRGTVISADAASRAPWARLVERLHARLIELGGPVTYVRGSWTVVAITAAIGVLVVGLAAILHAGWLTPPAFLAGKTRAMMVLGAISVVAGPLLTKRSRPRPYDPRDLPPDLVPR
ncbi:MAG: hypothetical protein KC464_11655 [Myxococcales bacterium]|nr:hypothetical protein [Myxococcales bacterium]